MFCRADLLDSPRGDVFAFESTVKTSEPTYSVADIRAIIDKAHLSSGVGDRKTIVVFDADRMTTEAANAFLKTLEDVPQGTFFILTVTNRGKLLETVLSRCVFVDSGESALQPSERMRTAIDALVDDRDPEPMMPILFPQKSRPKPDRAECLGALAYLSSFVRQGRIRDAETAKAIGEAFTTIASTNVIPSWEFDRVVLKLMSNG